MRFRHKLVDYSLGRTIEKQGTLFSTVDLGNGICSAGINVFEDQ